MTEGSLLMFFSSFKSDLMKMGENFVGDLNKLLQQSLICVQIFWKELEVV